MKKSIRITRRQLLEMQRVYKTDREIALHLFVPGEVITKQSIESKRVKVAKLRAKYEIVQYKASVAKKERNQLIYSAYVSRLKTKVDLAKEYKLHVQTIYRIINKLTVK